MEMSNTYMDHDNVLIHVIEHDIVLTQDIIFQHKKIGKWSDVKNFMCTFEVDLYLIFC